MKTGDTIVNEVQNVLVPKGLLWLERTYKMIEDYCCTYNVVHTQESFPCTMPRYGNVCVYSISVQELVCSIHT